MTRSNRPPRNPESCPHAETVDSLSSSADPVGLPDDEFVASPHVAAAFRLERAVVVLQAGVGVERDALRDAVDVGAQRDVTFQGALDAPDVHPRLTFGPRPDHDADGAVPCDQPAGDVVGEQGRLAAAGWLVHDDVLAVVGLHRLQHLVGGAFLPRRRLPTEVAFPEVGEVVERPLRLGGDGGGDDVARDHRDTEDAGGLQTAGGGVAALKSGMRWSRLCVLYSPTAATDSPSFLASK